MGKVMEYTALYYNPTTIFLLPARSPRNIQKCFPWQVNAANVQLRHSGWERGHSQHAACEKDGGKAIRFT